MRIKIVAASLNDITGGILASGVVPHPRLWRADQGLFNAGVVTITAAEVDILTVGTFGLAAGDRLLLVANVTATKGGVTGLTQVKLKKGGGTADVNWMWGAADAWQRMQQVAGEIDDFRIVAIGNCVNGGDYTVLIRGDSAGSDSTVAGGAARAHLIVFAGS